MASKMGGDIQFSRPRASIHAVRFQRESLGSKHSCGAESPFGWHGSCLLSVHLDAQLSLVEKRSSRCLRFPECLLLRWFSKGQVARSPNVFINLLSLGGSSVNEMLLRVTWGRWVVFAGGQSNICYLKC